MPHSHEAVSDSPIDLFKDRDSMFLSGMSWLSSPAELVAVVLHRFVSMETLVVFSPPCPSFFAFLPGVIAVTGLSAPQVSLLPGVIAVTGLSAPQVSLLPGVIAVTGLSAPQVSLLPGVIAVTGLSAPQVSLLPGMV